MRAMWAGLVMVALGAALGCGAIPDADHAVVKERLRAAMEEINRAWEGEDLDLFSRMVDHDAEMINFGSDVSDRWIGWEGLEEGLRRQFETFSETRVDVRALHLDVSPAGDAAWVAQAMSISTKFLDSPVELEARFTGVFARRPAGWRLVHFHYSIPISESRRLMM